MRGCSSAICEVAAVVSSAHVSSRAPSGAFQRSQRAAMPNGTPSRGAPIDHAYTERTTFVIAPGGKITAVFSSGDDKIAPSDHATKSLAAAQKLAKPKAKPR